MNNIENNIKEKILISNEKENLITFYEQYAIKESRKFLKINKLLGTKYKFITQLTEYLSYNGIIFKLSYDLEEVYFTIEKNSIDDLHLIAIEDIILNNLE